MSATPEDSAWIERRVREELTAALERATHSPAGGPPLPVTGAAGEGVASAAQPDAGGRPVTFNAAMVRAILAGNKSETRRPIRPQPSGVTRRGRRPWPTDEQGREMECTLARVGEILWVREPWSVSGTRPGATPGAPRRPRYEYEADLGPAAARERSPWRAGRFLPRDGCRLELQVRQVFPQRLGDLKPQEAIAEGVSPVLLEDDPAGAVEAFRKLWDEFYGLTDFAWENNPWVWVVRFKSVEPPEEERR